MGRFRVSDEDDPDENLSPQAQHFYSSSADDVDKDDRGGFWRGPLVSMAPHCPQNNNDDNGMELQNEHTLGGSPFQLPSVAIRRSRRDNSNNNNDDDYGGLQPHSFEYEQPPPPPRTSPWFRIFLMALMAHLLARYGPVAPPPEAGSDSWEDFWVRELRGLWRSAKLVGYTVPKYALEWVVVGLYDDAQFMYHKYQTYREEQAQLEYWSNCSLTIPDEWNLEVPDTIPIQDNTPQNYDQHLYSIVGQSRAVQAATKALGAWAQSAPLLLYFAGSRGNGKLELARQISQRVFGHCLSNNDDEDIEKLLSQGSGPVMMIQGQDFASFRADEMGEEDGVDGSTQSIESKIAPTTTTMSQRTKAIRMQLYESVMRHAKSHPNGTVVILQHVEEMAGGLLPKLVQDLTNPSRYATTSDEGTGYEYSAADERQSLALRLQQACEKTVFIMTSMVGSKSIARSIQTYGGTDNVQSLELELLLMHEIDMDFNLPSSSDQTQRIMNSVEVGSKFHALAPFFPMEQPTLAQILSMKIHQWSRQQSTIPALRVTQQALDALLHESRVEYLTVMKKSTQTPLLTFSSAGGQFLRDGSTMMNGWQASVKKCFRSKKHAKTIQQANSQEQSDDEAVGHDGQAAVFDYESWSQKAVIMVCPLEATRKDRYDLYSRPLLIVDRAACEETCRFGL